MKTNNTYLHFVAYKELGRWDVQNYLLTSTIHSAYTLVKLNRLISPQRTIIKKEDYIGSYSIVEKIAFKTGQITFREENKTGMDLCLSHLNELLVSSINFHQGAVAVNTFGDIVASTHYKSYHIDISKVLPSYLVLVLRSPYFLSNISASRAKGIKNESGYNVIGEYQIPLPSLAEQQALVDAYESKINNATNQEKKVQKIEQQIDDTLLDMLQVNQHVSLRCFAPNQHKGYSFLEFYHFKELSRWDLYTQKSSYRSTIYPHITFSKVMIDKPMYGAGYKSKKTPNEIRYIRITDINEDGSLNDDFVSAEHYDDKYLLKQNDFLIARSGNTVGKTFLYDEHIGKAIFAGYLIRFRFDETQVNLEYLLAYTKCSIFKQWIANNMRVSGQPNINSQQYMDASLILPPMEIQQQIAEKVRTYRQEIANCKTTATTLRQEAITQFEQAIFE